MTEFVETQDGTLIPENKIACVKIAAGEGPLGELRYRLQTIDDQCHEISSDTAEYLEAKSDAPVLPAAPGTFFLKALAGCFEGPEKKNDPLLQRHRVLGWRCYTTRKATPIGLDDLGYFIGGQVVAVAIVHPDGGYTIIRGNSDEDVHEGTKADFDMTVEEGIAAYWASKSASYMRGRYKAA